MFTLLLILAQAPAPRADSSTTAAVRAAVAPEPVDAMGDLRPHVPVKDIRLLDIDGDGRPEAFVWIEPGARQTPTILVYTYDAVHGAHRLVEGLVPGRLQPVTGHLVDDHTLGVGVDMTVRDDGRPVDYDRLITIAAGTGMSIIRHATFMHADSPLLFVHSVYLSDRSFPTPDTNACQALDFSP